MEQREDHVGRSIARQEREAAAELDSKTVRACNHFSIEVSEALRRSAVANFICDTESCRPGTMSSPQKGWQSWMDPRQIPTRGVLGILSFFGFFTNYMLRVNLNIAIVEMTGAPNASSSLRANIVTSECIVSANKSLVANYQEKAGEFDWDTKQQSLILGSFYWSYIVIMVPGGLVAEKYGGKLVYGGGNLVLCLMGLAIPLAARINVTALIFVRLVQGLAAGVTWPAMHVMASQWIPPHERSKFVSTYMGNSVGIAVTYPLCGVLIDAFGWEAAFYVPGLLCLLWCAWWWFCAFDSPSKHPRISKEELSYLEHSVVISKRKLKLPLKHILKSVPFWALVVANVGTIWAFMTVITYGPTYLKMVHGLGIRQNGLLSGLPNLSRFVGSLIFSWAIDSMIASNKFSLTFARKLATAIAQVIPAFLFMLMGNIGCNANAEIALLTVATFISGSASSGTLVNSVDLAPNFSGSLLGLISIIGMSSGFVVPLVVGMIIQENQSMAQWRYVFMIAAALGVITTIIFTLFGSGDVQSWNEPDVAKAQRKNRRILKTKNTEIDPAVTQPLQNVV